MAEKGAEKNKEAKDATFEKISLLNMLYSKIIERYKKQIEEAEAKTISALPSLVTPRDPAVEELKRSIIKDIESSTGEVYNYQAHFLDSAKRAFEIVNSYATVSLPLEFWFLPKDVIEIKAGDVVDKAILLCSLLISFGNEGAKIFLRIINEGDAREAYVVFEFNGAEWIADLNKGVLRKGKIKNLLKTGVVYEFNDKYYAETS